MNVSLILDEESGGGATELLLELEGLELDERGGGGTELLLGGCSGSQFDTICATPALTNSIQAESDTCEQVPAFNLQ